MLTNSRIIIAIAHYTQMKEEERDKELTGWGGHDQGKLGQGEEETRVCNRQGGGHAAAPAEKWTTRRRWIMVRSLS